MPKRTSLQRQRKRAVFMLLLSLCIFVCMTVTFVTFHGVTPVALCGGSPCVNGGMAPSHARSDNPLSPNNLRSASHPVEKATIFVSLAAFRDAECVTTVESLLTRAKYPERVFIGISEERYEDDVSCISQTELFQKMGITRTRTLRWMDVVPSTFASVDASGNNSLPRPLLHPGRDKEVITCLLARGYQDVSLNSTNTSVLDGCQIVTRVGVPDDALGPTYARYISSLFFNNQDYYMVIDSHSRFIPDWDVKMIERARLMPTQGVMSHYPNGYTPEDASGETTKTEVMTMCKGVIMTNGMPKLGAGWIPIRSKPVLQGFVAAGYIFGDSQYVRDVPFDPYLPYLFDGEEILYTARLWTSGWDSYSPAHAFLFHNYNRVKAPRYWSVMRRADVSESRELTHQTSLQRAMYLLRRCVLNTTIRVVTDEVAMRDKPEIGKDEKYFGMGNKRPLHRFWRFVELSDEFITKKDNEGRWRGGEGLCPV